MSTGRGRGRRPVGRIRLAFILSVAGVAQPAVALAQADVLVPIAEPPPIRWWHGAIVLVGISALTLVDGSAQRFFQERRSASGDDLAAALRHFGQPEVFGTMTAGLVVGGLLSHNDELTRAGGRLALTLALAGATSTVAKFALGRPRPNESLDVDGYAPFSGQEAMPSGHTTMAFALATALADDIHRPWATVGLYAVATGVGWSRLNDNKHWLSDVAMGAGVGITSAKLVDGRWRLFHLHPPTILLGPRHAAIAWQVAF